MKFKMYSIQDLKANLFSTPMFLQNDSVAIRNLTASFAGESMLVKYPNDFELFCVGEFDDHSGQVVPLMEQVNKMSVMVDAWKDMSAKDRAAAMADMLADGKPGAV